MSSNKRLLHSTKQLIFVTILALFILIVQLNLVTNVMLMLCSVRVIPSKLQQYFLTLNVMRASNRCDGIFQVDCNQIVAITELTRHTRNAR